MISPQKRALMIERLDRARDGAYQIADDLDLGPLLEEAQAAPNTRRLSFGHGSIVVVLASSRSHAILGPLVSDPARPALQASQSGA
jgi:hypothetical protein